MSLAGNNELVLAMAFLLFVNALVCVLCMTSTALCVRSTFASILLARHTDAVFRRVLGVCTALIDEQFAATVVLLGKVLLETVSKNNQSFRTILVEVFLL